MDEERGQLLTCDLKQPEHISMATDMGNMIIEKYAPDIQNAILRHIRQMIAERRARRIEETEKELAYLKQTFGEL